MQNVLDTGKRALSAAVAVATIAFSIGAAGLLKPVTTHAASAGQNFKSSSLSSVYYYGYDGMRYTYPNENTYKSWYMTSAGGADFSAVQSMSDSDVSNITLGGNIVVRPGTYWVKVMSDPKLYAVGRDGQIHWIESETVASGLRGSDWNSTQTTIDVPDVFFTDYTVGTSLMSAAAYDGMLYSQSGVYYLDWDGASREVTSAGLSANGLKTMFAADGASLDVSALSSGSSISSADSSIMDAAQTVASSSVSTGALTLSASSSMPAAASLAGGANSVEVFKFNAAAGSADAALSGVVLSMIGAGATANISNVYLYEGDTRLTDSKTINSSTRQVTFANLGLSVSANSTRTFTVRVTTSTSQVASDTFGFKINASTDVTSGGSVSGSYPITGNTFTFTGTDVGTLTITKAGSIANPTLGAVDATIGQFKITDATEAASLSSMTLKIDNATDHSNFKLWKSTTLLATGVHTSGDWVLFDLTSPLSIEKGGNVTLTVSANIGGQSADTVKVYVDNSVDVVAAGTSYGFGLSVDTGTSGTYDGTSCTSTSGNCSYSTIQGGQLTFAFSGPSAGDIQTDSQDQALLNFSVTAAQAITVLDLNVAIFGADNGSTSGTSTGGSDADGLIDTAGDATVTNIQIVNADTGAVVSGPIELPLTGTTNGALNDTYNSADLTITPDAVQKLHFTDDFAMSAGETLHLSVRANISSTVTSGTAFEADLLLGAPSTSTVNAEDENGDALVAADIVPGSTMAGYDQTANSATITFALASTPGDVTTVRGTTGVNVVSFNVTAGTASSVKVTDLILSAFGDDNNAGTFTAGGESATSDVNTYVSACSLYEGSTLLSGPKSPNSAGTSIDFDTIRWTVSAGAVTTLKVLCDFANAAVTGTPGFAFTLADSNGTDVTAEDASGSALAAAQILGGDGINGVAATVTTYDTVLLAGNGSLAIVIGSDMPTADFMLTNSSNNLAATYTFTATNENFQVQTLSFSEEQAEDDQATADSALYANNISLVTLTYPKADGTTGTATAGMSGNVAKFSGLDMSVAIGAPATAKVYVNLPQSDRYSGGSATSNERIRMALYALASTATNYKAVGLGSGVTLTDTDSDGSGTDLSLIGDDQFSTDGVPTFVVRETKPTISLPYSSPSGSAVAGRVEALRFDIAAASNQDVVVKSLIFKVSASTSGTWNECDTDLASTNIGPEDFDLYDLTVDSTTTLDASTVSTPNTTVTQMAAGTNNPWTILSSTTTTAALCSSTNSEDASFVKVVLPTAKVITKGTTHTFALYFDATGANAAADDSVRFDIPNDPIASSYRTVSNASNIAALAPTATVVAVDDGTAFAAGDVIIYDADDSATVTAGDEAMLVTSVSTNDLNVVRGYLGNNFVATASVANTDDILRLPGSLFWQDDGSTAVTTAAQEYWGSYLVDNLTVTGGTLVF